MREASGSKRPVWEDVMKKKTCGRRVSETEPKRAHQMKGSVFDVHLHVHTLLRLYIIMLEKHPYAVALLCL